MILIVGCGNLGTTLARKLKAVSDEKILATYNQHRPSLEGVDIVQLDVTDENGLKSLADSLKGEELTVFWLAAFHNVDRCAKEKEYAGQVNITALKNFFFLFHNIKAFFLSSTDCVYGESKNGEVFSEDSPCNPINEYGRQKKDAEEIVLKNGGNVFRFSLLMGDENPLMKLIESSLKEGSELELIHDSHRNSLTYSQAVEKILHIYRRKDLPKVVNICGSEALSKYDMGKAIAEKLGLPYDCLVPVSFDDFNDFAEPRAKDIILRSKYNFD